MNDIKPGYLTTEFWTAVGVSVAGIALAVVPLFNRTPDEAQALATAIKEAAAHIGGAIVAVVPIWHYIRGRAEVKAVAMAANPVGEKIVQP